MTTQKRKSGIPTGHAGEYAVMAELLARGFDAQLADRNTRGYDLLVGKAANEAETMKKVQVKTVRAAPWYIRQDDFREPLLDRITVYVLLGGEDRTKSFRFFIARNCDLADKVHVPNKNRLWRDLAFMNMDAVKAHEGKWNVFDL